MRRQQKKQAEDFIRTLFGNQASLKQKIEKRSISQAIALLGQCQQSAVELGTLIENAEGEGFVTVNMLEDYCESAYQLYEKLNSGTNADYKLQDMMHRQLEQIKQSIETDIKETIEVVFLPYKASMWDSLESVWKAADQDPDCDAYVVPIPYYDRKPDKSNGQMHYEGEQYPDYVPITSYDAYDLVKRHPDMIFIHNPYDQYNYATSVPPFFYSKNLKKHTDKLIYIPYFITGKISLGNIEAIEKLKDHYITAGVLNADQVIVESEGIRQIYIDLWTEMIGENSRTVWENRILGLGSPKIDKILNTKKEDVYIPAEWRSIIQKSDGTWKKIILYNTSIRALLQADEHILIAKMKEIFHTLKEKQDEIALIWRPHPLIPAMIKASRPALWEDYENLVQEYLEEGWGIYDDSGDVDRAVVLCDAYYGDRSSVIPLCQQLGKPIMIQRISLLQDKKIKEL